jgi:hypothetical protein
MIVIALKWDSNQEIKDVDASPPTCLRYPLDASFVCLLGSLFVCVLACMSASLFWLHFREA